MGLRKILTVEEPTLHKVCRPVTKFDEKLHQLLDDMGGRNASWRHDAGTHRLPAEGWIRRCMGDHPGRNEENRNAWKMQHLRQEGNLRCLRCGNSGGNREI